MNIESLTQLHATTYDRSACEVGIVHIGYGAFHRAHQAVYVDDYMQQSGDLHWGIAAVNLRAADTSSFSDSADATDGYVLKTVAPNGDVAYRKVRSHVAFSDWSSEREEAEGLLSRASVHAATITVTESGYYLNNDDGSLNSADPVIAGEIAGAAPSSIYGYLASALTQRSVNLNQPISILCCDNIRANGRVLERNFLTYLNLMGMDQLADWVRAMVTFPCSMVDRITPRATKALVQEIGTLFPDQHQNAILAEAFSQWVLEDRFAGPIADLAKVGVEVVTDVDPYEEAKIRILNGGHTALAYLGALAGHKTFDQAMQDPAVRGHFDGWEAQEVLPGLTIELPFDKHVYRDEIAARFSNSAIADTLERICMDGWSKMPLYVRPTLDSCLKQGITPKYGYDSIASWYIYARRFAAGTMPIPYHEPYWDDLEPLLASSQEENFAKNPKLWDDLAQTYPEFVAGIVAAIKEMEQSWPI